MLLTIAAIVAFTAAISSSLTYMATTRISDRRWGMWLDAVNKSWNASLKA